MSKIDKSDLAKRMKVYEQHQEQNLLPTLPAIIRLDGKCFHKFTKGLQRPFDPNLHNLMVETTKYLVQTTNACIGYTQSDEISLVLYAPLYESEIYFGGRIFKILSILAGQTANFFNKKLADYLPEKMVYYDLDPTRDQPVFDCRVFNVPSLTEAVNYLIWREADATRNSLQMLAQYYFSHKQLQNKGTSALHEMLHSIGVNWNDWCPEFKRGSYIQKKYTYRKFTAEEISVLPKSHAVHQNPDLMVCRSEIRREPVPPLRKVFNRETFVFNGVDPLYTEVDNVT